MLWGENRGKWKKASSRRESNQGHPWLEPPVLCHWATVAGQPPTLTILCMCCTGGIECLSHTPGSHSVCAVRTPLGVDRKILSIRKELMLSGFLTLNAQTILPHAGKKWIWILWGEIPLFRCSVAEHWWLKPGLSWVRLSSIFTS